MAVRGFEGFETYGVDESFMGSAGWNSYPAGDIISSDKRTGTYCFQFSNALSGFVRAMEGVGSTCLIAGICVGINTGFSTPRAWCVAQFRNSSSRALISIQITALGAIQVVRGGLDALSAAYTVIGTSDKVMQPNTWNHIEVKMFSDPAVGYVTVRVNGKDFYSLTGVNTQGAIAGNQYISAFAIGAFDSGQVVSDYDDVKVDDIVWWDSVVDGNHDGSFIGQHGVTYLPAIADATYETWLLSSGVDSFALIDDITPDEDTTYIYADATGLKTAVDCAVPPANVDDIECIAVVCRSKKSASGDADLRLGVITQGGTESDSADIPQTTSYYTYFAFFPVNPQTSGQWNTASMPEAKITRQL